MTTVEMPGPIPQVPCRCWGPHDIDDVGCVCSISERALRAGVPLTPEQREWCINEVASIEGHNRAECNGLNDADLGRAVLDAWTDYCRDKGLI